MTQDPFAYQQPAETPRLELLDGGVKRVDVVALTEGYCDVGDDTDPFTFDLDGGPLKEAPTGYRLYTDAERKDVWGAETAKLNALPEGVDRGAHRNDRFNNIVFRMAAAGFEPNVITDAVEDVAKDKQIPRWRSTLQSALRGGYEKPALVYIVKTSDVSFEGDLLRDFTRDDIGIGERFMAIHGSDMRNVPGLSWLDWNGGCWEVCDARGTPLQDARYIDMTRRLQRYLPDNDAKAYKFWLQSRSVGKMSAAIRVAAAMSVCRVDALDCHKDLLCVGNGTLDLRRGIMRPHAREDLITRRVPIDYDPDAKCPAWIKFLDEIFEGDADLIEFIQRACGYSLTGQTNAQKWFILQGNGSNGKSTFITTLAKALGPYSQSVADTTLASKKFEGIPVDLARMRGARLVFTSEPKKQQPLDSALVKKITGGDEPVAARFMRENLFEYIPVLKLWLACNDAPEVDDLTDGFWRRVCMIPFNRQFRGSEIDPRLPLKLQKELAGILTWALEGASKWYRDGEGADALRIPAASAERTKEYRTDADPLSRFFQERCKRNPVGFTPSNEIFRELEKWCQSENIDPISKTALGKRLRAYGYKPKKGGSLRGWVLTLTKAKRG